MTAFFPLPLRWVVFLTISAVLTLAAVAAGAIALLGIWNTADRFLIEDVQDSAVDVAGIIQTSLMDHRREIELLSGASELRTSPTSPDALRRVLRKAQEISPHYALVGFVDVSGTLAVTSNGLAEGAKVAERSYWTLGRKGIYIGDAHDAILLAKSLGSADKMPRFIDLAAPVREENAFLGVVVAHLSTDWARDVGEKIMNRLFTRYKMIRIDVLAGDGATVFSRSTLPESQNGSSDLLVGTAMVGGLGEGGTLSWPVRISVPRAEAARRATGFVWSSSMLTLLTLITGLLMSWWLAGRIARPIEALTSELVLDLKVADPTDSIWSTTEVQDIRAAARLGLKTAQLEKSPS